MTKVEFEEQKKVLKEHEEQKRKKDQQKAKYEVKQALGESITAAEQQQVLDEIKNQAETGRKQGSPDQSNLDVGRKDMRKQQSSLQPHVYDNIPGGAGNDSANIHRRHGNQGKLSSIVQGERLQNEGAAFHADHYGSVGGHGGHADYDGRADHGRHGVHHDQGDIGRYDSQHKPVGDHDRGQAHEYLHDSNRYQGDPPPQHLQYGDNCYHSDPAPVHDPQAAGKPDHHYVNVYEYPEFQQYIQPNSDAQPMPPDHAGASHHHYAVNINPNLMVNSRIQIPTASSTEPFIYGIIRWIGEISAVQGLVAGIEMASALYCYYYQHRMAGNFRGVLFSWLTWQSRNFPTHEN